ncbi:MAG: hypothetical protein KA314_04525 [Chloroflexi bacterium]|nr:hypothetical protein [Chloroflexota bacterium]
MRGNGWTVTIGLFVLGLFVAALLVLSFSIRAVTSQGMTILATAEARPPTVGERASDIREQTRLDNNGMKIPFVVWFFGVASVVGFLLTKLESLLKMWAELQKLWNRGKKKVKAPSLWIENPNAWPQPPHVPTRPQLPNWSRTQLPGGEE